jgi:hypothetical protein
MAPRWKVKPRRRSPPFPGLAAKGRLNPFVMVLSDNDTKLSGPHHPGRLQHGSPVAQGPGRALGWKVIEVPDGHDLAVGVSRARTGHGPGEAPTPQASRFVCDRQAPSRAMESRPPMDSASGGHGFPLANGEKIVEFVNEIYGGQTPKEFARLGAGPADQDWEAQGRGEEGQGGRESLLGCRSGAQDRQGPVRPGAGRHQGRPGRLPGVLRLLAMCRVRPASALFQKSFPNRFDRSGRGRGQHG